MVEAADLQSATCPTRPTSPTSRNGDDGAIAGRHDRTANWRVLVQGQVSPGSLVVRAVARHQLSHAPQRGHHRPEAYPPPAGTSTPTTRTDFFSRDTALAGLANDGRLTPTVAAIESLPAGAAQSAKTGPGKTVLTLV
jgi:hypothetical protein